MKTRLILLPLLLLAACDKPSAPPTPKSVIPSRDDLAAQLAAQPTELADLRRRCRSKPEVVGADTCSTVARATRIQLTQAGPSAYAPGVVGATNETGR